MTWAPSYVTRAQLKGYLSIDDANDDALLDLDIAAASRKVDNYCNRQFGQVAAAEQRKYTAERGRYGWSVWIDDLQTLTGLAITINSIAVTDTTQYTFEPVNDVSKGLVYTQLQPTRISNISATFDNNDVLITAKWGWNAVPDAVADATLLYASLLSARRNGGAPPTVQNLDQSVKDALEYYRRLRWL